VITPTVAIGGDAGLRRRYRRDDETPARVW